jgi:hypothetical protein
MIHEDYLLKLIQELGQFLRRIVNGESSNSAVELNKKLEQFAYEVLGLPATLILSLRTEELIELFTMSDRMVIEKCYLSAEANRLKATVETDTQEKRRLQERAVFFYTLALPDISGEIAAFAKNHLKNLANEATN